MADQELDGSTPAPKAAFEVLLAKSGLTFTRERKEILYRHYAQFDRYVSFIGSDQLVEDAIAKMKL